MIFFIIKTKLNRYHLAICPSCKCTGDDDDEERNDDLKDCACPEGAEEHSYRPWFTTYKCCKYPPPRFRHWPPECEQENLSDEVVPNNNDPTMVNGPPFCPPPSVRLVKSVDRVIIYSCCKYPAGYSPCYS